MSILCLKIGDLYLSKTSEPLVSNGIAYQPYNNADFLHAAFNAESDVNRAVIKILLTSQFDDDIIDAAETQRVTLGFYTDGLMNTIITGFAESIHKIDGYAHINIINDLFLLKKPLCEKFSPSCRAQFGDARCKLDITDLPPCDKTLAMCKSYNNIKNFRGEPFVLKGVE